MLIKLKAKLLFPLSILIIIVLILSIKLISNQYYKSESLLELQNNIDLATKISQFVHSTQKERGLSSGFLASKGLKFKEKLIEQRKTTDKKLQILLKYNSIIHNKQILQTLNQVLIETKKLDILRIDIDKLAIDTQESIKYYSTLNKKFLNIIIKISKISKIPLITQNILAYINFLYAKENLGIERAVGTTILVKNKHNKDLEISFIKIISIEKLYTEIFFKYASKEAQKSYLLNYKGKDIDEVKKIREIILYKDSSQKLEIKPEYWFTVITNSINKLGIIDNYLEKEILHNISTELKNTQKLFKRLVFLIIISIIIFFLMVTLIASLIKSEKRHKKLIDKYIISSKTDIKGNILDVSDAFCDISGYSRAELIGQPHNLLRHPDMPKHVFKTLWDTITSGKVWDGEIKNLKKNGDYYWVYAHIEPLFDKKGNIEGYVAVRLDITDSINLEEELQRSKQKDKTLLHQSKLAQMGEMISMIAHQWRQPLTAISSTSSDLYMKIMLDNYDKDYFNKKLEKIDDLSQHLSDTIDDFRNFYKEDNKKQNILHSEMAKNAFEIVSNSLEYKNISLKSDFQCKRKVKVLANELRQVVLNLIKNAEDILIEKNISQPYIKVKTYDDKNYSYLEVTDNGGGIPDEIMEKIFDPYFSTKIKKDGTGLGLYMSKIIVEDHCNGTLLVSNTPQGAKFTIKIPITEDIPNV